MTGEDKRKVLAVLDGLMEGTSGVVRATIMACKCAVDEMEVEILTREEAGAALKGGDEE